VADPDLTWNLNLAGSGEPISAADAPFHIRRNLSGIETKIPAATIIALNMISLEDTEWN
jgi:hypothetical protein